MVEDVRGRQPFAERQSLRGDIKNVRCKIRGRRVAFYILNLTSQIECRKLKRFNAFLKFTTFKLVPYRRFCYF